MARMQTYSVFRYDPARPEEAPHMQEYRLEDLDGQTLFIALNRIREEQDPSLRFDFVCRASICGTCGMLIDGKPGLACKTRTKTLPDSFTLHPLPVFRMLGDLTVDTGSWFRLMAEKTGSWIHTDKKFNPHKVEEKMDNGLAQEIYELDRCIECGCCIGGCGTALMRDDFIGAAGLLRISRFMIDPRDERGLGRFFDVVGTDDGVFGCMGLMACEDYCPKGIPLQKQLAFVRRRLAMAALKGRV